MINKVISYRIFRIAFTLFLIANIVEPHFAYKLDLIPFIHISELSSLKYVLVLLFALMLFPLSAFREVFKDKKTSLVLTLIALLLTTAYFSAGFSEFPDIGFSLWNRFFLYFIILIICAAANKYYERLPAFLLRAFIFGNCIIITGSVLDFFVPDFNRILIEYFNRQEVLHSYMQLGSEKIMRPMGFISDSNLAAFSISIALLLLLLNHNRFNKPFRFSFYITGIYVFGMLASRSSLLMCIICLSAFYLYKMAERRELLIFIFLFILFQLPAPQTYGRIISFFNEEKGTAEFSTGRPVIWNAAWYIFTENPLIGKGPGAFFFFFDIYIKDILKVRQDLNIDKPEQPGYHKVDKVNPHNIFLVMLAEIGLTGFILFTFLLLVLAVHFFKRKQYISLLFFLSVMLISSLSNFAPYYKYYLLICIVLLLLSDFNMKIRPAHPLSL